MTDEKMTKALEALEKAQRTVARHEAKIAKLEAEIAKSGISYDEAWENRFQKDEHGEILMKTEILWGQEMKCYVKNEECFAQLDRYSKLESAKEDLKNAQKKVEIKQRSVDKITEETKEKEREARILKNLPPILKKMMDQLEEIWNKQDKEERDEMTQKKIELGIRKFHEQYGHCELIGQTDAQIEKNNHMNAVFYVTDLYRRLGDKVGDITSWEGIHGNGVALNGWVYGTKGTAHIETIRAGGYNIQRLHVRTIIH